MQTPGGAVASGGGRGIRGSLGAKSRKRVGSLARSVYGAEAKPSLRVQGENQRGGGRNGLE